MEDRITIPVALQIRIDDVAWHNGADERHLGRPSRTGMPRKHCAMDYPVINELGKALNMKINCSIVLGEWDKDNLLRGQNCFTWDPDNWDRASEIDLEDTQKAFDLLENSEYIAYNIHGVMHGHYDRGRQITEKEFYTLKYDEAKGEYSKEFTWQTSDGVRKHLDYFFKLYHSWGFQKPVVSFSCGNGTVGSPYAEGNIMYAGILKEYGIDIWPNGWHNMTDGTAAVIDGIVAMRGAPGVVAWNAYDVNPDYLPLFNTEEYARTDFCIHWPNLLRWNPESNLEYLPKWIAYFNRQAEVFGSFLSRDPLFAGSQAVYNRYADLRFEDQKCIIDLSNVDAQQARALRNEFYISLKNGPAPEIIAGGTISEYESRREFKTYRIVRDGSDQVILTW